MKKFFAVLGVIVTLMVLLGVYVTYGERNLLIEKKHEVKLLNSSEDKVKVVQFTDTQLGDFYTIENLKKAVDKINSINPDIVVFTGDLIDNASTYEDKDKISGVLSKINCANKYAIYGNHDYGGGAVKYYKKIMTKAGFTVLQNQSKVVEINGRKINILGADDALMGEQRISSTMAKIKEDQTNILLSHEPDVADKYIDYPIDLILSGHSHGGQVYIPFYGPGKTTTLAKKYTKGFYDLNNERETKLYVNSGLGNTRLPFRFGNIPQVSTFLI